jgi:hypothetical protein
MGFVFGVLFVFGMLALFKAARFHRRGWGGGWHHDDDRPRRRGGHWAAKPWRDGAVRAAGEVVKRRLKVDEDQEGIVDLALADLRSAITSLGEALRDSRTEVVEAFRGDRVDDDALDAIFVRQDQELARARREAVSALRQIHAVLDPEQREAAVTWLGSRDVRYV